MTIDRKVPDNVTYLTKNDIYRVNLDHLLVTMRRSTRQVIRRLRHKPKKETKAAEPRIRIYNPSRSFHLVDSTQTSSTPALAHLQYRADDIRRIFLCLLTRSPNISCCTMNPMWFAPPNRPLRPATDSSVAAANTVAILTLLLPQGAARSFTGLPPILYIAYNLRRCSTGKIENDYLNAINVFTCLMRYLDFCVINVPERDFHRVRPDGNAETESDVRNMTIWQKFRWNFDLFMTMRGVGWNWRVKNVEAVPMQLSRRYVQGRCMISLEGVPADTCACLVNTFSNDLSGWDIAISLWMCTST